MELDSPTATIAACARESARSRTVAAESENSRLMSTNARAGDNPSANDRQEPTVIDHRPPLEQLPVYTGEGTVSSWVLAEGWSEDAWMSAVNTIPEGAWR